MLPRGARIYDDENSPLRMVFLLPVIERRSLSICSQKLLFACPTLDRPIPKLFLDLCQRVIDVAFFFPIVIP